MHNDRLRAGAVLVLASAYLFAAYALFPYEASAFMARAKTVRADDPYPIATKAENDLPSSKCSYNVGDVAFPKCPITAHNAVWGDSLAYAWRPFAEQLGSVADLSRQGCGPFLDWLPDHVMPADKKCRDFNAHAVEALRGMDTVVIAARWNAERMPAFEQSLAAVAPHVKRVVIIGPSPELTERVPKCIRHSLNCDLARSTFDARAKPLLVSLRGFAKRYPNVEVVDVTNVFCNASACPAVIDGAGVYADRYHPTTTTVRRATRQMRSLASR